MIITHEILFFPLCDICMYAFVCVCTHMCVLKLEVNVFLPQIPLALPCGGSNWRQKNLPGFQSGLKRFDRHVSSTGCMHVLKGFKNGRRGAFLFVSFLFFFLFKKINDTETQEMTQEASDAVEQYFLRDKRFLYPHHQKALSLLFRASVFQCSSGRPQTCYPPASAS